MAEPGHLRQALRRPRSIDGGTTEARRALTLLDTHEAGSFNLGAAEIVEYHPATRRVFVVNAEAARVSVLELSRHGFASGEQALEPARDIANFAAGSVNSVAVSGNLIAVAVAATVGDRRGRVAFYDAHSLGFLGAMVVGFLPDMLTFTPDGRRVLVANEGEQVRNGERRIVSDPAGSVSIIDLTEGLDAARVVEAGFTAFDERIEEFRAKGVRIPRLDGSFFESGEGEVSLARDLEPEYIAVSADGKTAWVTLQENDALAVLDVNAAVFVDILPLGSKDFSVGLASLENVSLPERERPVIGTTPSGQRIRLGGLSGLWFEAAESSPTRQVFYTIADHGPNADRTNLPGDGRNVLVRPHVLPGYTAAIHRLVLEQGGLRVDGRIPLLRSDGVTPITGRPNHPDLDETEVPVDTRGRALAYDAFGGDFEGIVRDPRDRSFWLVDEYRPAIYNFSREGILRNRFVPEGTAARAHEASGHFGTESLPTMYARRSASHGFEAVALDPVQQRLYAFVRSPLDNPGAVVGTAFARILVVDTDNASPTFGVAVAEYLYTLEASEHHERALTELGDAVFVDKDQFLVIERDSSAGPSGRQLLFRVDLTGATNILGRGMGRGPTLEQSTLEELVGTYGVVPVHKRKLLNLPTLGYQAGDKVEGLALMADGRLAVLNDNDFGLASGDIAGDGTVRLARNDTDLVLGLIRFDRPNGLDASDRDGVVNVRHWPVLGSYMPDAIQTFQVHGRQYLVTANEGDTRGYDEVRVAEVELDPHAFPDSRSLQSDANLGRLKCSALDGDLDGDGDLDQIHVFGGRSLSILDDHGNLVFDTGSLLEDVTRATLPGVVNSNNDRNGSFDTRSDDKGPEPEGLELGTIGGRTYAFLGLERIGGIVVLDVTEPARAEFIDYVNFRDFSGHPELGTAGDLGPEGLKFVAAESSPTGHPVLLVGNEVSGTTSAYRVNL